MGDTSPDNFRTLQTCVFGGWEVTYRRGHVDVGGVARLAHTVVMATTDSTAQAPRLDQVPWVLALDCDWNPGQTLRTLTLIHDTKSKLTKGVQALLPGFAW